MAGLLTFGILAEACASASGGMVTFDKTWMVS